MNMQNKQAPQAELHHLRDLVQYYLGYWKWFLLSFVLCFILGIVYFKMANPVYNIFTSLVIKTESSKGGMMEAAMMKATGIDGLSSSSNVEDEVGAISSQTMMRNMVKSLDLNITYTLKKFPFNKSYYNNSPLKVNFDKSIADTLLDGVTIKSKIRGSVADIEVKYGKKVISEVSVKNFPQTIKTDVGSFLLEWDTSKIKKDESYTIVTNISGIEPTAESFRERVSVGAINKKSNIIELVVTDTDTERGKDILNKLTYLYNQDALDDKNKAAHKTVEFITDRLSYISKDLNKIEVDIEDYKKANNLTDIASEASTFLQTLGEVQTKGVEFEVQSNIIKMLEEYMKKASNKYSLIPSSLGMPESTLKSIENYNAILLERSKLLRNTSETNPAVLTINEQIDGMRENVFNSIEQVKREIQSTRKDWGKKESDMQSRMRKMPTQERIYLDMQRQQIIKSELYVFLLKKLEESELTLAANTPKGKIIDEAYNMYKPISPNRSMVLIISLLMGLLLPVAVITLMKVLKFKLSTKEELEENTHLPVLGEICLNKSGERIVVRDGATNSIAELFRLLRTNIQFVLKKEQKVLLITSSISGEGKSFFTLNLGLSFSLLKDKKVVIVGLDIRNPKLAEYLSVKSNLGVTNYLSSEDDRLEDIIISLKHLHPNLYLIPSGPVPPNPTELLLRDKLDDMFEELRKQFDYILVDSAPIGMVSDTFTLDRISDMTLFLYRANYTNRSHLKQLESVVRHNKLRNVSIVMNGTTSKKAYGYGYGSDNK